MHVVTKWDTWYQNQNSTTKQWLDKQPIWHDRDMWMALGVGIIVGIVIGLIV